MSLIPDWLRYETQHRIERFQGRFQGLQLRESVNDSPKTIAIIALVSILLPFVVLLMIRRPAGDRRYDQSKTAWFYDMNTGKLFVGGGKEPGPIEAPSGPLPDGSPAGFKAYVYRYARAQALEAECKSNLRQLAVVLQTYTADHDGVFPGASYLYHSPESFDRDKWPEYNICCRWHDERTGLDSALGKMR